MIKVLLVDDHELVRSAVEVLLNAVDDVAVVATTNCGEEVLGLYEEHLPDIVLMDLQMPGIGGVEACRRLLKKFPKCRIIAVSIHISGSVPQQVLKLGAKGYISKSSPAAEMVGAIRTVMDGKRYLCTQVEEHLTFPDEEGDNHSPFARLSQRETEVVNLILQGKSIQEMSDLLVISDKTVNTYRYRLYDKLKVRNDVELTRLAMRFNHFDCVMMS